MAFYVNADLPQQDSACFQNAFYFCPKTTKYKGILAIIAFTTIVFSNLFCQTPQAINYQAVARDANGLLANQQVSLRVSIIDSAAAGSIAYVETHKKGTNQYGLFSVALGTGTVQSGSFVGINWSTGNKWIQID